MKTFLLVALLLPLALPASAASSAIKTPKHSDLPKALMARAKVPVEQARAAALAAVPGANLAAEEIEDEGGRLVYSFELEVAGSESVTEVNVDALTGSVVDVQKEDAAAEAAEQAADQAALAAPEESDLPPELVAQAKVGVERARATALAAVPGGTLAAEELEQEHGRLIYSFEIKVSGKAAVTEVNISAADGSVVDVEQEDDAGVEVEQKIQPIAPPGR